MATFFDDFSELAVQSGVPFGYSEAGASTSGSVSVVEDAGTPGGKSIRINNVASGVRYLSCDEFLASSSAREVAVLMRVTNQADGGIAPGPAVRLSSSADTWYSGHLLTTSSSTQRRQVRRRVAGSFGSVSITDAAWSAGVVYALRLSVDGDALKFRYWAPADVANPEADEPAAWNVEATDSNIASGLVGFGMEQGGTTETFVLAFGVGTGGDSAPLSDPGLAVPVPTGFTFTASGLQLDGAWSAVSGADSYDWEVERDDAGSWVAFDNGNTAGTSFQVTSGVAYGTTYRARVRAVQN